MDSKHSAEHTEKAHAGQNVADISGAARQAERALRLKIDLMVVPIVTLLYLMCFIDRTNIAPLSGAFGGLLASGILNLSHFSSLHGWQMIFAIEGILTMGIALLAFATLTDRPETARWLTEEQKQLAIDRVKVERLAQSTLLDKIDATKLKRGFLNPITLSTAFVFLLNNITVLGISFFLPTIIRTIYPGHSTIHQQLLTVPPYLVGAFFCLILPTLSWRVNHRQAFIALTGPTIIIGYSMFLGSLNPNIRYAAIFLCASTAFTSGALCNAQVSANVISDSSRNIAIGANAIFGYIGGLIATWTFLPTDAPRYAVGNSINLTCAITWTAVSVGTLFWMKYDNKRRDEKDVTEEIAGLPQQDVQDLEWKHPSWRWKP
ncbi:hypothetical protein N0V90_008341 [Kalmusia sp. IMI 367209]|nr:hypothetical protein N0V90_008341 [Kalmusia sp. IMI 367209]